MRRDRWEKSSSGGGGGESVCWIEVLLKSQGNLDLHPRYRAMLTSFLWENVTGECVLADSFVMLLLLLTEIRHLVFRERVEEG